MGDIKTDLLVRVALKNGLVDEKAINEAMRERAESAKSGQGARRLGDILVEKGLINFERARLVLREQSARSARAFKGKYPDSPVQPGEFEEMETAQQEAIAERSAAEDVDQTTEADPGSTQRREQQARFGEYRLIQRLGADAAGVTYHAVFLRDHRAVTLRILNIRQAAGDPEAVGTFMRTVKRAYKLEHPNIQKIITAGRQDKRLYYAAEYFTGHSLRKELSRNLTLPVGETLDMAIEITKALEYAHNRKIYHTQIDPAKIILGSDGHVKLIGFGLGGDVTRNLDWLAESLGDLPYYVAPEMATGEEGRKLVGATSDLYSLGAVLFHCLTGTPPFHGDSLDEVLLDMYQCENLHERLAGATDVPPDLAEIVLQLLAPEPQKRTPSAHELLAQLQKVAPQVRRAAKTAGPAELVPLRSAGPHKGKTTPHKAVGTQQGVLVPAPKKGRLGSLSGRIRQRLQRRKFAHEGEGKNKGAKAVGFVLLLTAIGIGLFFFWHLLSGDSAAKDLVRKRIEAQEAERKAQDQRAQELLRIQEAAKKEALRELQRQQKQQENAAPVTVPGGNPGR